MICRACKGAGALLVEARRATLPGNRMFLLWLARDRHAECEADGTCTCHHRISINRKDVIDDGR